MNELLRRLEEEFYWFYGKLGDVTPACFASIGWSVEERKQFWRAHRARFSSIGVEDQIPFLFAYEAEHLVNPIRTTAAAYDALARISGIGYDVGPGLTIMANQALEVDYKKRQQAEHKRQQSEQTFEHRRHSERLSMGLPTDGVTNLAAMRAILKMPPKKQS